MVSVVFVVVRSLSHVLLFCDPLDNSSLPGSSVHGISQVRVLEQIAISFSGASSQSRDQTRISCIGRWSFYCSVTRETLYGAYYIINVRCLYKCPTMLIHLTLITTHWGNYSPERLRSLPKVTSEKMVEPGWKLRSSGSRAQVCDHCGSLPFILVWHQLTKPKECHSWLSEENCFLVSSNTNYLKIFLLVFNDSEQLPFADFFRVGSISAHSIWWLKILSIFGYVLVT